jgi:hypothetical protein
MKESEIRAILERLCTDLDTRRGARIAGAAVVGTSLALGTGCGGIAETRNPEADSGVNDGSADADAEAEPNDAAVDQGPLPPYMAPDSGPSPDYMAVDAAPDDGPTPVYMSACAPATDRGDPPV